MSYDARMWARRQRLNDSSAKHLLKTYADWAAEDYTVWVSSPELVADTEMNPKTITKYIRVLTEMGYLRDTGERRGRTRQIPVFQMTAPADAISVQAIDPRTRELKVLGPPNVNEWDAEVEAARNRKLSKNGAVKYYSMGKTSDNGNLPSLSGKYSENAVKAPQKRRESSPKAVDDMVYVVREILESNAREDKTSRTPRDETGKRETPITAFDRFWATWPSVTGRKQAMDLCRSHWDANGLEAHAEAIIAHVSAMKLTQHWKTGGDPTPIRYLEQRRWRDGTPADEVAAHDDTSDDRMCWWRSASGIEAKGAEFGLERPLDESMPTFLVRVAKAAGRGPWVQATLDMAKQVSAAYYREVAAVFGTVL
ncbi:hypothetical protein C5O75_018645 [Burkholderia cepacia]|uniref:hypothetical protein n=1 Tax=Burkholderia cepacia TaxID=292 RepID=UPI000CF0F59A|nr:hypothetical protein [Burkholderia cepacia]KAB1590319.1 hypothetical protein C5O75_018645 [Burkholderia cepacia]